MLKRIKFAPGIDKEGSQYTAEGTWFSGNRIRFRKGRVEKMGGWEKHQMQASYPGLPAGSGQTSATSAFFRGVCRSLFDWGTSTGDNYVGVGTSSKLYIENGAITGAISGDTLTDITPVRATTAAGDVTFSASNGSSTITVNDVGHGANVGDYVIFSGAATLGGLVTANVLNHEYEILTVASNSYTITAADVDGNTITANASDTGNGGASVVGQYQLNSGTNTFLPGVGFSVGTFGSGLWSGGGAISFSGQLRLWSQDEFADDLICNPRAGDVFYWDSSAGGRAVALANMGGAAGAPTTAYQVMVSPVDRHTLCFGVDPYNPATGLSTGTLDPLLVRWSTQESAVDWAPTAINTAGGQVLSTGTKIIGAVKTRQEIIIFTDTSLHSMRFVGAPFVFNFAVIAENLSMVSPKAGVAVGDAVYFMDLGGFYIYRGAVERVPCTVLDEVFSNINRSQLFKVFAATNPDRNEVTWYYPIGEDDTDITNYVTFNYFLNCWSLGTLNRGAWIHAPTRAYPMGSTNDTANLNSNYLFNHEYGYDDDTSAMAPTVESGSLSIDDGESFMFMRRIIPDFRFTGTSNNVSLTIDIMGRDYPLETMSVKDTVTLTASDWLNNAIPQKHVRVRAREFALKITGGGLGYGWTMGDFRFDIRTDGKR